MVSRLGRPEANTQPVLSEHADFKLNAEFSTLSKELYIRQALRPAKPGLDPLDARLAPRATKPAAQVAFLELDHGPHIARLKAERKKFVRPPCRHRLRVLCRYRPTMVKGEKRWLKQKPETAQGTNP